MSSSNNSDVVQPPRFPDAVLRFALPAGVPGDAIRGDLIEEYGWIRHRRGRLVAGSWFWIQGFFLAARFGFGLGARSGPLRRKGNVRDIRVGWRERLSSIFQDVRFATRSLVRTPTLAVSAILTLALGLGANSAVFGILYSVVIADLPYQDSKDVVVIRHFNIDNGRGDFAASFPQFLDYQERTAAFDGIGAWRIMSPSLTAGDGQPAERITATAVTANVFSVLGINPSRGRGLTPDDDREGATPVALLSHAFWVRRFGADAEIVGRQFRLDGGPVTIVGVLPRNFNANLAGTSYVPPGSTDVWLPYRGSQGLEGTANRGVTNVNVIARIAAGVSYAEALSDIERVVAGLREEYRQHARAGVRLIPAREAVVGSSYRRVMLLLFAAVTSVLLIACANVITLVLSRLTSRQSEVAVRTALGSSRGRLIQLFLTEGVVLAGAGAIAGLVLAQGAIALLQALDPGGIPRFGAASIGRPVFLFTLGTSLLVALLVGLAPMLQLGGRGLRGRLQTRGESGRHGIRHTLVVAQVGLAVILLVAGGLMSRSVLEILKVDPGFDHGNILTARIQRPGPFISPEWRRHVSFFGVLLRNLEGHPGIDEVAAAYADPVSPGFRYGFDFAAAVGPDSSAGKPSAIFRPVTPGYFHTNGIPFLKGRPFTDADNATAPGVVIVNQAFVDRFLPRRDPLGVRLNYGHFWRARPPEYEIVGVVANVRFNGQWAPSPEATYFPHAQQPVREMTLTIRTAGDPLAMVSTVREAVRNLDPVVPVDDIATMEARLSDSLGRFKFITMLFAVFSVVAIGLAAVGLYGVFSFTVAKREREIGIRMAVGAQPGAVVALVLGQGFRLVVIGVALGLGGAFFASRLLTRFLFYVSPNDPVTFVTVSVVLLAVAVMAGMVPVRRAIRTDPVVILRAE